MPMADAERVVVAVSSSASCKDAVKWALAHKIKKQEDTLVFLHIVSKIPSPMGVDMYQSEVNNTMFVHFVRTVVQPMMLQLKKMVDPKVKLELKVARNNAIDKGLVEESRKLNATIMCLGVAPRASLFGGSRRSVASGTGAYCIKAKPPGVAVFVIQKDKVVMSTESTSIAMSPDSSASTSPANSGRLAGGGHSGKIAKDPGSSGSGGFAPAERYSEELAEPELPARTLSGKTGLSSQGPSGERESSLSAAAAAAANKNTPPAALRLMNSRASKYGTWNAGNSSPESSVVQGGIPEKTPAPDYGRTVMAGSVVSSSGTSSLVVGSAFQDDSASEKAPEPAVTDIDKWAKEIQEKHHTSYMKDLENRLSHARAALASFPTFIQDAVTELEKEEAEASAPVALQPPAASVYSPSPAPVAVAAPPKPREPVYLSMDETDLSLDTIMAATSSGIEGALLRELAVMRKKASEADKARQEAERRAEQLMAAADLSLREVAEQTKRRDMENAAFLERVSREVLLARQASEEEARKAAALAEAKKREQQQRQDALEAEARRRVELEEIARREIAMRTMRNYQQYTWAEISNATDNWSLDRKIGEGGFGTVYRGTVHHTPVAIKVLKNTNSLQAASEFQQEVEVLGQIQHPHIVMLLGCCAENYALVYEFMAQGSLEDRLACKDGTPPMPWFVRFRVIAEVASALLALHTRPVPIVHRDLKPANVLLTKNYVAKLGDVGLAKLMPDLGDNRTYMRDSNPVGTFAYVDPEFQRTGEYGPKSDVYALGIVLLDLLTGRKPSVYEHLEEAVDDRDMEKFLTFLDPGAGTWPPDLTLEVAIMAVRCSEMRRRKRPDLERDVMPLLDKVLEAASKAEEEELHQRRKPVAMGDAPTSLFCPITQEIMVDPVLASDGHTYELVAIQQWLETNDRSPMTNNTLPNKDLVPNHAVRSMIREWQERKGLY